MIQLLFFLKFRTQLRKIRPELITALEKSIVEIIEAAGGKADTKHRVLTGLFNENSIAIWLTIITVMESILEKIDESSSELYGFTMIVARNVEDYETVPLCSALAEKGEGTGVWCAHEIQSSLSPYINIEEKKSEKYIETALEATNTASSPDNKEFQNPLTEGFIHIYISKNHIMQNKVSDYFPFREKILRLICYGAHRNAVLLSPAFIGKRDGIYKFCSETLGEIPPLILRFGKRNSIGYFGDMLSPKIHSFIKKHIRKEILEELEALQSYLFQERLMEEYSAYIIQKALVFFQKLLNAYSASVQRQNSIPVLIIERIHYAYNTARDLCLDVLKNVPEKTELLVYGTCSYKSESDISNIEKHLEEWRAIFPRVITFTPEECPTFQVPVMPCDLWEMLYTSYLLSNYFPGFLFPKLFEEEERKSSVLLRSFAALSDMGVIDTVDDPLPRVSNFIALAESHIGDRKDRIRQFVRNCLHSWVLQRKLRPCFSLLEIFSELGGKEADKLILESIYGDVINGTYQGIENAIKEKRFSLVVGAEKSSALHYIFSTLKALIHDKEETIREVFKSPMPQGNFFSGYMIQILSNLTAYYLGIKYFDSALETVKEAMLIGQNQRQGIAQAYRLLALINIAKQRVDDSLEYVSFAVDNAEKSEHLNELGVAYYYAAQAQFLSGNLSKAEHFALKSEQTTLFSKRPSWADRARFLRGKLLFEMGRYKDALNVFVSLKESPVGFISEDMDNTLSAWIFRTTIYTGFHKTEKLSFPEGLLGQDAFLFEIEASYIMEDYEETLILTQRPLPNFADFLYIERPDWKSGFSQGELLLQSPKDLWERMIFSYRALALCKVSSSEEERKAVIQQMQRFTRDVLMPGSDPHDVFHFYVYYRILLESSASEIDLNTAMSMAFRRLQRRANRIDDAETRRSFLNNHYWNSALNSSAKEYKLI